MNPGQGRAHQARGIRVIFHLTWRGNPDRIFATVISLATARSPGLRPPGRCPRACPCHAGWSAASDSRSFPSIGTGRRVSRSTNTCTK